MSIVLRTNKGSALTYDEMDRNQSQFFYSSSKSPDGLKLRLHYTGSDNLDTTEDYGPTRYHEISFPVFQSEVSDSNVAGDNTQIQFNTTVGDSQNFDAKSTFVFTKNDNSVGIGTATPLQRLDIHGDGQRSGTIALRGSINNEDQEQGNASVKFYNGLNEESLLGQIGRIEYTAAAKDDIYIHAGGYTANTSGLVPDSTTPAVFHISLGKLTTSVRPYDKIGATFKRIGNESKINVGINNNNPTLLNLSVVGNQGIGVSSSSLLAAGHSIIKPLSSSGGSFYNQLTNNQHTLVTNDSIADGIEISSPETANGGNILVIVNTDSNEKESFNIITARQGVGSTGKLLATFQASGKVGIGTNTPLHEGLTIEEELTIRGLETGTSASTKTLVATSTGLVKQIAAAPVPIGGIIMWSGTIANIPDGWVLCNGVSTGYGVTVPNLTNKFIVGASADGAGSTYPGLQGGATGGSKDAVLIQHNHGGVISGGNHKHDYQDGYHIEEYQSPNDILTGYTSLLVGNNFRGDASTDSDNRYLWQKARSTTFNTHSHTIPLDPSLPETGVNKNLPPYYALAYIMYVGV